MVSFVLILMGRLQMGHMKRRSLMGLLIGKLRECLAFHIILGHYQSFCHKQFFFLVKFLIVTRCLTCQLSRYLDSWSRSLL